MRQLWIATAFLVLAATAKAQMPTRPMPVNSGLSGGFSPPTIGGIGSSQRGSGPGFSPYLNLNRGGNSPAANLYGIVRPQQSFQNSLNALQNQVATGGQAVDDMGAGIVTGTRVRFLNTGGFFLNMAGGTSGPAGAAMLNRPQPTSIGGTAGLGGSFGASRGGATRGR